ncbi:MAG: ATP-binding cassette domain-containing protein [Nitrososphaerales archaeon]
MVAILTEQLTKVYPNGTTAVDNISFGVEEGEIFGFLGPNGAGKTTAIMILTTLLKPTSGRALVSGYDVDKQASKVRANMGYVSQEIGVDEHLTGRENLMLQGRFSHMPKNLLNERIEEALDLVELKERANDIVGTYSGGMRKRLDIAGGLVHKPKVLFLDEPTLGLDIHTRHRIWDYINKINKEYQSTIFLTTHYMEEADKLCNRIAIIDHGKIRVLGKPNELKQNMGTEVIVLNFGHSDKIENFDAFVGRVRELREVGDVHHVDNHLLVSTKEGETLVPKIFKISDSYSIKIASISLKEPSLDDVFLAYTGKGLRDEDGTAWTGSQMAERFRRARA